MENPILNQLSNMGTIPTTQMGTTGISNTIVPQQMQQIKNTINMLKSSKDPQSLMNYLCASNPQFKGAMNIVNQNGGNPKEAFYVLAKQKGIDPNSIISALKS